MNKEITIIANWKSNKSLPEVEGFLAEFEKLLATRRFDSSVKLVLAPAFPALPLVSDWLKSAQVLRAEGALAISLAAQDISPYPAGSYTGAVSARNLEGLNLEYVLVGHSERRHYFGESNQVIANKIDQALSSNLVPILCLDDPDFESQAVVMSAEARAKSLVAYEALSAIGTGQSTRPEVVIEAREQLAHHYDLPKFIYGGSVTAENVGDYLEISDGLLVGGASLKPEDLMAILDQVKDWQERADSGRG